MVIPSLRNYTWTTHIDFLLETFFFSSNETVYNISMCGNVFSIFFRQHPQPRRDTVFRWFFAVQNRLRLLSYVARTLARPSDGDELWHMMAFATADLTYNLTV